MSVPAIVFNLEGATPVQAERCRSIIHTLFQQGLFNVRNGSVTLHFDHEGTMQEMEVHVKKWRRSKPDIPLPALMEPGSVKMATI